MELGEAGRSLSKYSSEGGRLLMGWQPEAESLRFATRSTRLMRQTHLARRRDGDPVLLHILQSLARGQRPMGVILGAGGAIHKDAPEKNVKVNFSNILG